jgi:hypothetical protein
MTAKQAKIIKTDSRNGKKGEGFKKTVEMSPQPEVNSIKGIAAYFGL